MGSSFLGFARLMAYAAFTVPLMPIQALLVWLNSPLRHRLPRAYHAVCARILGFQVDVAGQPAAEGPTLVVSNHSSYLDIIVLGSLIRGSFVAKTEVGGWPFFGLLAKLQHTVFVDRKVRNAGVHRDDIKSRLEAGDTLILFPEGTSSDGNRTLPFKTALFSVASLKVDGRPVMVQPVSVTAVDLDGIPLGRSMRPFYAWYGDMELAPHLWQMVRLGRITIRVEFHEPVTVERFGSRKALAEHCWRVVAAGVDRAVAGRQRRAVAPPEAQAELPIADGAPS
ncbi:1-acyl-sn-glycerol-3-phosphate acyltransferase [Skermanella aerolata]|uniref:1-acyl-sn-glycerol-3-phosphate acyltransferase n=1 Tax=Skermanella aerolata TaxID=393310 RepID=A0A512DPN2_9PROT|nr:lysophospholipid acyltransferase family protein [Skermanella aerolata]KJB92661.1 1-acyl-sn-glycerol-3-phosphate acyltransferase [Skermanella aerolata KACC 11604]GEO38435.1 1-acyl-sn-glycerol-3-phosphate acyltransferase [Skermanella aerolata]